MEAVDADAAGEALASPRWTLRGPQRASLSRPQVLHPHLHPHPRPARGQIGPLVGHVAMLGSNPPREHVANAGTAATQSVLSWEWIVLGREEPQAETAEAHLTTVGSLEAGGAGRGRGLGRQWGEEGVHAVAWRQ